MNDEQIEVEPANAAFAKAMKIGTLVGLAIMIGAGIVYFTGIHDMVNVDAAVEHWDEEAPEFWEDTADNNVGGYSWFATHPTTADGVAIMGIALIALVPLLSLLAWLPKVNRKYKFITVILLVEFMFGILRPFF